MKTATVLGLAALLPAALASAAQTKEAGKAKVRTKEEVQVKAAAAERTKIEARKETGPAKPALRAEEFIRGTEAKVAKLRDDLIFQLDRLIEATSDKDPEKPDLYFRKAELLGEKSTYYDFQARGLDEKIFAAVGSEKERLEKEQKGYDKESQKWTFEAVKMYLLVAQSDNPVFRKYDRMDHVLFYLAFLLTQAKKQEQARVFFLRLIKDYPTSKFIPDAYLSFAEYYFYEGDMDAALKFYDKVAQYPDSKVYGFALYKEGWCYINLQNFEKSLNMFVQVIKLADQGKGADKLGIGALQREAKRDSVRSYSEIGSPENAWKFFQSIGGDFAPKMLELLADTYYAKGKFLDSIKVYRQMMSLNPDSPSICAWQNEIVRSTLAARSKADQVKEVQRLAAIYEAMKAKPPAKKDVLDECRQATSGILRELATIWHKEAQKTQNNETYDLAQYLYKEYLDRFPDEKDSYTMRFYYAELLFKLGEVYGKTEYWERAAEQYTLVVSSNPKGEHATEAAYATVIAWKNALNIDETASEKLSAPDPDKPLAIPEKKQKLLDAFTLYIQYVPNAPELVQIKYNRARIYYEYNHFAEAAPMFDDIATNHSKHELAVFAANLYLDCLNILKDYGRLDTAVDRYLANADLNVDTSMHEQLLKLKQGSQWKHAEQLSQQQKHKEAALLYVEIANAYPTWERYPQVLYNAAIQFEAAYLIGQAIKMREHLIEWDADQATEAAKRKEKRKPEPLAQKAVYEIGANYHALAWYSKAADYYEKFATNFPGEKDAPKALYAATLFRMGLGEDKKALENSDLYVKNYGRKRSKDAAAVFFEMYKLFEAKKQVSALIKHLELYLKQWGAQGGVDRQIIAHEKLGEIKWKLSCEQPEVSGACIEVKRIKARAVKEVKIKGKKRRKGVQVNLKQCGPDTKMRITVFNRKKGWAKAGQDHFAQALSLYGKGKALAKVTGADETEKTQHTQEMMYAVAASRFYQGEDELEKFLRIEFPEGLTFNEKDKKKAEDSKKQFKKWLDTKGTKLTDTQGIYQEVILFKVAHWAIAAAARIGQLYQTFSDQLFTAPIPTPPPLPPEIRQYIEYSPNEGEEMKQDFYQTFRDNYCDALVDKAEPLEAKAIEGLQTCLNKSTELSWFNEWSHLCETELNQIRPTEYPIASEIRLEPGQVASVSAVPAVLTEVK
jgi:tetratricopeptide (TPR) repeat protein